jgi:hypothetical protein
MNRGLPFAVTFAFLVVYNILARANPWYSLSAIATVAVILGVQWIVVLAISRIGCQFDKT